MKVQKREKGSALHTHSVRPAAQGPVLERGLREAFRRLESQAAIAPAKVMSHVHTALVDATSLP